MVSRILALLVWAAVAASVAYWGLRWFAKPLSVPPGTGPVAMGSAPRGDFSKLWTGPAQAASAAEPVAEQSALAARIQLLGVVAPRTPGSGTGVALLVVDGKPSRAYQSGQVVDGEQIIQTVGQRGVEIGPRGGPATVTLNLPLLPPAATGSLPPAGGVTDGAVGATANPAYVSPAVPGASMGVPAYDPNVAGNNPGAAPGTPIEALNAPGTSEVTRQQADAARRLPPRMRRPGMVGGPPGGRNTDGPNPDPM